MVWFIRTCACEISSNILKDVSSENDMKFKLLIAFMLEKHFSKSFVHFLL